MSGEGVVISHHSEDKFLCVRQTNGAYGFIKYSDLMPYDVANNEIVQLKLVQRYEKKLGAHFYHFAQYHSEWIV